MICNLGVGGPNPSIGSFIRRILIAYTGKYQSGQMGQTVNLLAHAYGGSNPSLPTYQRGSYNGYYASLPSWKWEFDSPTPLKFSRCSSGVERILGKDEVMSSIPIIGSRAPVDKPV